MTVTMLVHNSPPMEFRWGLLKGHRDLKAVLDEDYLHGNEPTVTGK